MFRLFIVILIGFTLFSIYTDVTKGTIPTTANSEETRNAISSLQKNENINEEKEENLYMIVEVKAGDTVLTIAERITNGPIPVPINKLIDDFKVLNDNVTPEKLQIGREYKFPVYR